MNDLYREYILDLYRNPLNYHSLDKANHQQRGMNPGCGDDIIMYIYADNENIIDCSFEGNGCALCFAGASIVTEKLKGMSITELQALPLQQIYDWLGISLEVSRVKCVGLALRTAQNMLKYP